MILMRREKSNIQTTSILVNSKVTRKYADRNPVDEIKRAYSLFVADDPSGKISLRALRKVAKDLNNNLTDDELQAMIDEFDYDQDGYS